jgi:ABC-type glycerol-3-phosphate transport system permease component
VRHNIGRFIENDLTIPASYEEAAFMDGANRATIFARVMLPMVAPAVGVAGVLHFIFTWEAATFPPLWPAWFFP